PDERLQNSLEPEGLLARRPFDFSQGRDARLVHRYEAPLQYGRNQIFLSAEMVVDGREIYLRFRRNVPNRNALQSLLAKQLLPCIQNARPGLLRSFHTFVSNDCMN